MPIEIGSCHPVAADHKAAEPVRAGLHWKVTQCESQSTCRITSTIGHSDHLERFRSASFGQQPDGPNVPAYYWALTAPCTMSFPETWARRSCGFATEGAARTFGR